MLDWDTDFFVSSTKAPNEGEEVEVLRPLLRASCNRAVLLMNQDKLNDFFTIANNIDNNEPLILFNRKHPFGAFVLETKKSVSQSSIN